jgi:hypothetical protein
MQVRYRDDTVPASPRSAGQMFAELISAQGPVSLSAEPGAEIMILAIFNWTKMLKE